MPENASEVTAAGIARLAGVGRAAVSNWRRRHADFPKPVGGTETSPSFALPDVERWLREQGKLAEVPLRERVWQQLADQPAATAAALVRAGCVLLLVHDRPAVWQELAGLPAERTAELLPTALEQVLAARFGEDRKELFGAATAASPRALAPGAVPGAAPSPGTAPAPAQAPAPGTSSDPTALPRSAAALAAELGPREAFEFLLGRFLDANLRQYPLTPPGPAALMAAIAAPRAGATVLDPAAGTGALLRAVEQAAAEQPSEQSAAEQSSAQSSAEQSAPERPAVLCAQEADPDLAALAALRLALGQEAAVRVRAGDTLRADAFPGLAADVVLCHPPFNERNWGHEELAYDPRWEYGFPARTESELAWVQHALARLRPGGAAVVLMPPAAASRRSGRRIRAGLLRRGALRAVIALPAGAAPPYGIPLHLWVLRRPETGRAPAPELLLVDAAELGGSGGGRDRLDWQAVRSAVLDAWRPFAAEAAENDVAGAGDATGDATDGPVLAPTGSSRRVPVIELLDDDVDLAPARHVPPPDAGAGVDELLRTRDRLTDTLRLTGELTPAPAAPAQAAPPPPTTLGELARAGALSIRSGTAQPGSPQPGALPADGAPPVLTEHDVLTAAPPSGPPADEAPAHAADLVRLAVGDVVVPVLGGGAVVRVVDEGTAGAVLGRNLQLLRPDPAALDPWFLAGFLRGTSGTRQASSYASTSTRLDVRRLQLPRLPLAEQRRYGDRFRALAAFEDALRLAGRLGEQLVQGLYDGLTDGTVRPDAP